MAMSRIASRKIIMRIIYEITLFNDKEIEYNIDDIINSYLEEDNEYVNKTVKGIIKHDHELADIANKYLGSWPMKRLGYTDQALIKLGIYEMMYTSTPFKVCINTVLDLAKQYSDDDVVKIINSVLDKVYHNEVEHE